MPATIPMTITANASVTVPGGAAVSSRVEATTVVGASSSPQPTSSTASTAGVPAAASSAKPAPSASISSGSRRTGEPGHERAP